MRECENYSEHTCKEKTYPLLSTGYVLCIKCGLQYKKGDEK